MKSKLLRVSLLAAPLIVLSATPARAFNDGIWTDTSASGSWNDATKWSGSLPAYGATFTAYFASDITADTTVTQDVSPLLIGNLLFSDNGAAGSKWTLAGQPVTLGDGGSPALSTITTLTPTTISAQLIGANAITKAGASSLTLTGANTYSGGNNLQEGTLVVGNATALGTGPVSATGNPTLTYTTAFANNISIDGTNLNLSGNFNNLSGVISGTGNLTVNGTVQLTGANTFSGKTTISSGYFCFKGDSAFGAVPATFTPDAITVSGSASLSTYITGTAFSLNANRGIYIAAGNTTEWDIFGGLTIPGVISGPGALRKGNTNGGTLTLTNANTYTGGTVVSNGILSLGTGGTGADTSSVNALSGGGVTINTNGTVRLWIQNSNSFTIANNFTLNGGRLLDEDGIYTLPGTITLGANGGTIAANWGGKTLTSTGVISGAGTLNIAQGPSTGTGGGIIFTGANTYTGATNIQGATLSISSLNSVAGGAPASNLGAPTTVANGTLSIGSGTNTGGLTYTGTGATTDRVVNLAGGSGGATLSQSGSGLLKFTSNLTVTGTGSKTLTLSGSTPGAGEIAGTIVDNGTTGTTSLAATFAAAATTVTLASVDGVTVGSTITGTGITGGQTITAINTATKVVTLSAGTNAASGAVGTAYTVSGVKNLTNLAKSGSGTWTVSGTNTYTGTTSVTGGVLKFPKQSSLYNNTPASWTAANLIVNAGATAAFNIGGTGEFTVADINALQGLTNVVSGTTATLGFRNNAIIGLDTTNAPGGAITYSTILSDHVAGTTTDTLGLRKLGTGTLTLNAVNAYTAGTTIDGGTLDLAIGGGSGAIRGNVTVNAGATLKLSVTDALGYTQNFRTGNLTLNGGTIDVQHTGNNSPTSVGITMTGAAITGMAGSKFDLRNNGAGDTSVTTNVSAITSTISVTTLGMAGQGTTTFTTATGTTTSGIDLLVSSNLVNGAGAGAAGPSTYNIVKAGTGHMRLAGANTYTGTTTVNAGTLSGTGSATSALTVNAAGTLAPGSGIGTWSAKSATFVTGATFKAEINSTAITADKLAAAGAVDLGGATLSVSDLGSGTLPGGTKLTLVDYTGGSLTGTFAGLAEGATVAVGTNNFVISYADASKVTLSIAASGYSSWAATNAGGQAANLDFDGDGVPNGVEYFMGLSGSGFTANPKPVNGVISWQKDASANATYVVQVSTDLSNWSPAPNGSVTDNGSSVSYTLPPAAPKTFARLKVTTP